MPSAGGWSDRAVGSLAVVLAWVIPVGGRGLRGETAPFGDQEPVTSDAERGVMVEAQLTAVFEVSESEFLFQFLVVPFNQPAILRNPDEVLPLVSGGSVESQYLVGSASSLGHSASSHASG
jgi:hypothetical protein